MVLTCIRSGGNLVVARAVFSAVHEWQNAVWHVRLMEVIVRTQKGSS